MARTITAAQNSMIRLQQSEQTTLTSTDTTIPSYKCTNDNTAYIITMHGWL